jgi:hypothetical protein
MLTFGPFSALYFMFYEQLKEHAHKLHSRLTPLHFAACAAIAGGAEPPTSCCLPNLLLPNLLLPSQPPAAQPPAAFPTSCCLPNLLLPNLLLPSQPPAAFPTSCCPTSCFASCHAESVAGAASILTNPLDLAKTRLQLFVNSSSSHNLPYKYSGLANCFIEIVRREGLAALMKGAGHQRIASSALFTRTHCISALVDSCC